MKKNLLTIFLVGMMLLSIGLVACSTDQAGEVQMVGQSNVPLFDRAIPDDGTMEEARQGFYNVEKEAMPDMNIEVIAYTSDATLDEVVAWYDETLGSDWTKYEGKEENGVSMARWGKGDNIAFAVYYMPVPTGNSSVLFMEYAWK